MATIKGSIVWCGLAVHLATSLPGSLLFSESASPSDVPPNPLLTHPLLEDDQTQGLFVTKNADEHGA